MMHLRTALYEWHKTIFRDLPWKSDNDPYQIWLSEIILQQTRVEQGKPYYLKFIEKWPTVHDLAEASEDEVLLLWQGLGYYSRGRNLLKTAIQVVNEHEGKFPQDLESIKKLKGIGDYTAAAILSFAYNLPYPVMDGNVKRVISRWFDIDLPIDSSIGLQAITHSLNTIFDVGRPANFNQAMMDFGALQCTPKPKCDTCSLTPFCKSFHHGTSQLLPIKTKKIEKKTRFFHYLYIHCHDSYILHRREQNDIWNGLYQFPLIEADTISFNDINEKLIEVLEGYTITNIPPHLHHGKHVLTHQNIQFSIYDIFIDKLPFAHIKPPYLKAELRHQNKYGFPQLIKKFLIRAC
jgi:A/G-specific adenine glycosylase